MVEESFAKQKHFVAPVGFSFFLASFPFQLSHLVKAIFGQSRRRFSLNNHKIFNMFLFPQIKNKAEQNAVLKWAARLAFC